MKKHFQILLGLCLASFFQASVLAQTITSQPTNLTVNIASTATFTAGVTGATTYQWQFNGSPLNDISNIFGSATSTLTLENVTANQVGTYSVLINGGPSNGGLSSSNAVLTLLPGTIVRFILTNFIGGGTNFIDVQLFNHDKPVTVQNFLHYITAGAYTNMFFDRLYTNSGLSVLQGGDDGATDQTNTNPIITGWDIPGKFTTASNQPNPPFLTDVESEFYIGPMIKNDFGTIAMAFPTDEPNSATSAFFFNLADDSSILDSQQFTVFGRILNGSNVLEYFTTLTNGGGVVASELFSDQGMLRTNPFPTLPVNYTGNAAPANANLVFCTFQLTSPATATNLPGVVITSPTLNTVLSNGSTLTVQGMAFDTNNIGLASVRCDLIPVAAPDGTMPNGGVGITNYILGATNWSASISSVPPGTYTLGAQVMDEASNRSTEVFEPVIISAIITNGAGTVTTSNGIYTNLNAVGYPFQSGIGYVVTATPDTNELFLNWSSAGNYSVNLELPFTYGAGALLTATFISNGIPNSLAFTYPASNAIIGTNPFQITGTISNVSATPVTVVCHIFSTSNYQEASVSPLTNVGTTNFSVLASNLQEGNYSIEALATDTDNNQTVIDENFTVAPELTVTVEGPGTVSGATNGEFVPLGTNVQATANPGSGGVFYAWYNGSYFSLNPVQSDEMANGLALTAYFVTNNLPGMIGFTYPEPNGVIGVGTFNLTGTISNVAGAAVTCQIFSQSTKNNVGPVLSASGTTTWSVSVTNLPVGSYTAVATAVDNAGHGALISENFSVQYAASLQLVIVGHGTISGVTNGQMIQIGSTFQVVANPGSNETFYTWNNGSEVFSGATETFTMENDLVLTATFVPQSGSKGISITSPAANASLTTNTFVIRGKVASIFKPAQITCQIFNLTGQGVGPAMVTSGESSWSVTASNIPGGQYILEAVGTNSFGNSSIVTENFFIDPFAAAEGTYTGLFICTNVPVASTNSGFMTFTVGPTGIFSGKVVFPAYPAIPIYYEEFQNAEFTTGYFSITATAHVPVSPLGITIYLDLSGGSESAVGTIFSTGWSSQLICHRAVTKLSAANFPGPGKYVFSLQNQAQTNGPYTNGYFALTANKNGALAVSGALPDNTAFSQSTRVSKDGAWPIYAVPAGDKQSGLLLGWEFFTNSTSAVGQLYWYKAPDTGVYYTGGVGVLTNMGLNGTGTNFIRPDAGSDYSIVFQGGPFETAVTNALSVSESGQFLVSGKPEDKLSISLSASGVIAGSVANPNGGAALHFKGAFIGPAQGGLGFVPGPAGQTGTFQVALVP